MSAEQGDVEALVGVLKDLRKFAETVRPDSTPAQVIAAKDSANRGLLLLDRLAAALERAERERDHWKLEARGLASEQRVAEKAERTLAEMREAVRRHVNPSVSHGRHSHDELRAALSSEDTSDES